MPEAHKYERCEKFYDGFMCLYMLVLGSSDLQDEDKFMLSKCMTFVFLMKLVCDLCGKRLEFLADLTCHSIAIAQMAVHRIYFNCTVFPCDVLCFSFIKIAICRGLPEKLYHVCFSFAATVTTMRLSKKGVPWFEISVPFAACGFIVVMLHFCDASEARSREKSLASESRWKELLMRRTASEAIGTGVVELSAGSKRLRVKMFNLKDEISVIRTLEDMYMQDNPLCRFLDALESGEGDDGAHKVFLKPDKYFEAFHICTERTKEAKTCIVTFHNTSSEVANKKLTSTIEQYHAHFERLHLHSAEERGAGLLPSLVEDVRHMMQHGDGAPVAAQFSLSEALQSALGLFPGCQVGTAQAEGLDSMFGDVRAFRRLLVNLVLLFGQQSFSIVCREPYKNVLELACKETPPHATDGIEFAVVQSLCRLLGPFDAAVSSRQALHLYLWVDCRQKQAFSPNVLKGLALSVSDQLENSLLDPLGSQSNTLIDKRMRLLNTRIAVEAEKPFSEHIVAVLKGQHFRHVELVSGEQSKQADLVVLSSASLPQFLRLANGRKPKYLIVEDSLTAVSQIKKTETPAFASDAIVYPFNQNTLVHKLNHLILSNV